MKIGREPWWKHTLAWISAVAGGFWLLVAPILLFDSFYDFLASIYLGLWLGLPGMWWLHCHRKDKQVWKEYREQAQYGSVATPERTPRRWKLVAFIRFIALIVFDQFVTLSMNQ